MYAQACFVLLPALLWASITDLLFRRIDNRLVLALLLSWCLFVGIHAWQAAIPGAVLLQALLAVPGALLVLVVGFGLFRLGRVGAGDVKLMTVVCLWVGATQQLAFVLIVSLAGGLLALMLPLISLAERALALAWWSIAQLFSGHPAVPQCMEDAPQVPGIPYALAITLGALGTEFLPVYS
ncbi:hypothetical protein ALP05_03225 [Pseudomonas caricapapayae]|uniref:Prepilin type IV endopeptidase peptidase domain-containing protein n=1 Tax=Pseudomonas caricapapayae TaxID=46678 RepID=A0A3M6EWX6_9PSED|nr:prepilin peptidase [Pseudomonas caricapapayae]RMV72785.1 hypothetical protein ALP05_03225 [Pseudomonas caricapapayae]